MVEGRLPSYGGGGGSVAFLAVVLRVAEVKVRVFSQRSERLGIDAMKVRIYSQRSERRAIGIDQCNNFF